MNKTKLNIISLLHQTVGKDLSVYDESFLTKTLAKRMENTDCKSIDDYYHYLEADKTEVEALTHSLNNTYSEFFRNPLIFSLLRQWLLPSLLNKKKEEGKKEIRIWSVACAAGQEAYSLAILLDEMEIAYHRNVAIRIFASDISALEIEKAKEGLYSHNHLQRVPLKYLNEYFYTIGKDYKLIPRIRELVDFSIYDLTDPKTTSLPNSIFGSFDLIYCSNLLIYYNAKTRDLIIQKLIKSLAKGGLLITGESEREMFSDYNLQTVCPPAAIFKKETTLKSR